MTTTNKDKYYCWRCSNYTDMDVLIHTKLHEALDDIRAYGKATLPLNLFITDKKGTVEIRPPTPVDLMTDIKDKRKTSSFKEDEE